MSDPYGVPRRRASWVAQVITFIVCVGGSAVVVGCGYLALRLEAERILRTPDLKALVLPVELFARPADLYDPILIQPVDGTRPDVQEFTIHHKYLGGYLCGLALSNTRRSAESRESALHSLQMEMGLNGPGLEWSLQGTAPFGTFASRHTEGVYLGSYSVPRDAPLDTPIRFRIRFLAGGAEAAQRLGPLQVYVARTSDP